MKSHDLADKLAGRFGLSRAEARDLVDAVFTEISDAAANGEEVALNGFGKFKVQARPERKGRNPATGAAVIVKASRKLSFAPAKAVRLKLNG